MQKYIEKIKGSSRETKLFFVTALLYIVPVLVGAIYSFARLDYVRSYDTTQPSAQTQNINSK